MFKLFGKKQEMQLQAELKGLDVSTQSQETQVPQLPEEKIHENKSTGLENLKADLASVKTEEDSLLDEKKQLLVAIEQLRHMAVQEIEGTKQRSNNLRAEIAELREQCLTFAKALALPVTDVPNN